MAAPKLWKKDILLQAIAQRGGMTYGQIQQLAVLMAGLDYDERETTGRRRWRGFWSTTLTELLRKHCVKGPDRLYRIIGQVDRLDELDVRSNPEFRRRYESARRAMLLNGSRLPPGPFDAVRIKDIDWRPDHKQVSVTFDDSVGAHDVRSIHMTFPWPLVPERTGETQVDDESN